MKLKSFLAGFLCLLVASLGLLIVCSIQKKRRLRNNAGTPTDGAATTSELQPPAQSDPQKAPATRAHEFEAYGSILVTNTETSTASDFGVYVRDCNWLIRATNRVGASVQEAGYDGQGVVYRLSWKGRSPVATGVIESNDVPVDIGGGIPFLWQFFCSSCAFPAAGSGVAKPVYDGSSGVFIEPEMRRRARWTRASDFGPPTEIIFFRENPAGDTRERIEAIFRARTASLINATLVPAAGEYVRYRPTSSTSEVIAAGGEMKVTAIRNECSLEDFRPQLPAGITLAISDRRQIRSSTNRVLSYVSKNGTWPELEEARRLFEARRRTPARPK